MLPLHLFSCMTSSPGPCISAPTTRVLVLHCQYHLVFEFFLIMNGSVLKWEQFATFVCATYLILNVILLVPLVDSFLWFLDRSWINLFFLGYVLLLALTSSSFCTNFMLISVLWFSYLIASMGLQGLWSFGLACLDIYALRRKRDLQNPILVSLFVVGDWVLLSSLRVFSLTFSASFDDSFTFWFLLQYASDVWTCVC